MKNFFKRNGIALILMFIVAALIVGAYKHSGTYERSKVAYEELIWLN